MKRNMMFEGLNLGSLAATTQKGGKEIAYDLSICADRECSCMGEYSASSCVLQTAESIDKTEGILVEGTG